MKSKILTIFLSLGLVFGSFTTLRANIYQTLGIYQLGIDILKDADKFFQGYQYEIENLNPSFFKRELPSEWVELSENDYDNVVPTTFFKRFSFSSSVSTMIWSIFNYHLKAHLVREAVYFPQITVGFGHHFYLPIYLPIASGDDATLLESIDFMAFSGDVIVSKSINFRTKLFTGYRFAYGSFSWNIPEYITKGYGITTAAILNLDKSFTWQLHDLIFGVSYLIPSSEWETAAYLGFDPVNINIFSKLEFTYDIMGFGLGFYPNNVLKVRPFFRLFYNFI